MAVNDFSFESQANKGIITGQLNYYVVLQYRLKTLASGDKGKYAIPPLNAVQSAYYFPYLNGEPNATGLTDRQVWSCNDDLTGSSVIVKYPENMKITSINGFDIVETPITDGTVKGVGYLQPEKILHLPETEENKLLFQFNAYPTRQQSTAFNWQNEGKCFQYPYRYIEFNDGIDINLNIEPQYCKDAQSNEFRVRHSLNPNGTYEVYIKGYREDENGYTEKLTCGGNVVPVAKDAYLNYLQENQNQRELFQLNQLSNFVSGLSQGNVVGAFTNLIGNELNKIASEADMKHIPPQLSPSSNYSVGLMRQQYLYQINHRLCDNDMNRVAYFFHLYGYAQNKLMTPTFKGRKYWNYIQTENVNLKVNHCPKEHLDQLKAIFNNGVTVWHMEQGAMYDNLDKDNVEC